MDPNDVLCCFPVEVKVRDLDARLYLGLRFIEKGFRVLIGSKRGVKNGMFAAGEHFLFFDKGLTPALRDFYLEIRRCGGDIVSLDEENGVSTAPEKMSGILEKTRPEVADVVGPILMWGEVQKALALSFNTALDPERISVTGHPRFDLCKPAFAEYQQAIAGGARAQPGLILFNLHFSLCNNVQTPLELFRYEKKMGGLYLSQDEWELRAAYERVLLFYFMKAIEAVAKALPDRLVVVRPCPAEREEYYLDAFSGVTNIQVSRAGSVHEWITPASAVVHHDCTTGVESVLAGKPVFSFAPVLREDLVQDVPLQASQVVDSVEDLVGGIREACAPGYRVSEDEHRRRLEVVRQVIANVDFDSADAIVLETLRWLKTKPFSPVSAPGGRWRSRSQLGQRLRRRVGAIAERITGRRSAVRLRSANKFPGLSLDEVERRAMLMKTMNAELPDVRVTPAGEDTYLLERATGTNGYSVE
jgi:surface carbohydrate biosynthesis protein